MNQKERNNLIQKALKHASVGDQRYIKSGEWICEKSPTHAHHWVQVGGNTKWLRCKYCGEEKNV